LASDRSTTRGEGMSDMGVGEMPVAEPRKHVIRLTASAVDRQSLIRDRVHSEGSVTVDQLVSALGVSRMTVHRDLDMLETEGVLRKVRGGATALRSSLFESDFPYRLTASVAAKEAIGRAAARFVEGGQAVVCDESTTTLAALRAIDASEAITIITNCFPTMQYVNESTKHRLIGLGGDYVTSYQAFLGIMCEQAITNVFADVLLASCSAVRGGSTYHQDQQIVAVKRAMIRSASTRLLLLDSSKVDVGALYHLGEIRDFTHLITDDGTPETFLDQVRESGLKVVVAPVHDTSA
jgi:DeoR/GlpR family transcriptional regulator of sugar metabolism